MQALLWRFKMPLNSIACFCPTLNIMMRLEDLLEQKVAMQVLVEQSYQCTLPNGLKVKG